ncbi:MAG: hypothetical protein WAS21_08915 [Geminicoccaceae bacterium]
MLRLLPKAQRLDQKGEGRRVLAAARVVEVVASERRAPILQHSDQAPFGEMRLHAVLGQEARPNPARAAFSLSAVVLNTSCP